MNIESFKKLPVEIQAHKLQATTNEEMYEVAEWCGGQAVFRRGDPSTWVIAIPTLEGTMGADNGSCYIIRGVEGEFYPCRSDIFEATYERVNA